MERRSCIFRFADVEVDESNFSVTKAGEVLPLEPKVFKVLQFLLHHRVFEIASKDHVYPKVPRSAKLHLVVAFYASTLTKKALDR